MEKSALHAEEAANNDEVKSTPQDVKNFWRNITKEKISRGNSALKFPKPDLSKERSIDVEELVPESKDVQMPSVKELAMKFKASPDSVIKPKIVYQPNTTRKTTSTTVPQVEEPKNDPPKHSSLQSTVKVALSNEQESFDNSANLNPPSPQLSTEEIIPTEAQKQTTVEKEAHLPATNHENDGAKLMTIEQISVQKDDIAFNHHQPTPITIVTPDPDEDDEEVFSPPLPKTPPPNKLSVSSQFQKTPPPNSASLFVDFVDSPLPVSTSPTGDALLGRFEETLEGHDNYLLSPNEDTKWDVFAEINNNTRKLSENRSIISVSTTIMSTPEVDRKEIELILQEEPSEDKPIEELPISTKESTKEEVGENELKISWEETLKIPEKDVPENKMEEDTSSFSVETKLEDQSVETTSATDNYQKPSYYRQSSQVSNSTAGPQAHEQGHSILSRTKSLPPLINDDSDRRKTAIEVLATPPIFKPKEERDLIRLRSQIVRASRSGQAVPIPHTQAPTLQ